MGLSWMPIGGGRTRAPRPSELIKRIERAKYPEHVLAASRLVGQSCRTTASVLRVAAAAKKRLNQMAAEIRKGMS
jgi:hypothetical protein